MAEWKWTCDKNQAALDVAQDRLTNDQIAAKAGIGRSGLDRWKEAPEFRERVAFHIEVSRQAVMSSGIADKVNRIKRLDADWQRMQAVIAARALETPRDVIGAETGLIVRTSKRTKYGAQIEYSVDTALLAELRNTEMQAAKELGQITLQTDVTSGGLPMKIYGLVDPEEM